MNSIDINSFTDTMNQLHHLLDTSPSLRPAVILALDEAAQTNYPAEAALDALGMMSALATDENGLPVALMPELMALLRTLSQRDLALGLGYILTTFMAATNVWVAGSAEQKQQCNDLLADGKKISIAYHELDHGNDFGSNQLTAEPVPGGYLLNGRKQVINNIGRAGALVLQARTGGDQGMRTHSLMLIDFADLDAAHYKILPRFTTQGVRGCQIAGIEFSNCFVADSCLLGKDGMAFSYALTAFQITRALLPGVSLGTIDSALTIATRYCSQRQLYGADLLALPHVRGELSHAWLEYSLCDNLCYAVARGLHVVPAEMSVLGSLCKAQVPLRMRAVLKKLALVLGSRYYLREGEAALFEKIVRDYPVVSLGHASSLTCQAALAPQLPLIFKRFEQPRDDLQQSLQQLFSTNVLPPFSPRALKLTSAGKDLLFQSIHYWPQHITSLISAGSLTTTEGFGILQRLTRLHTHCTQLCQQSFAADSLQAFDAVQHYAWLQCAMATLGRWCFDPQSPFAGQVHYLTSCLDFVFAQLTQRAFFFDEETENAIISYLQQHSDVATHRALTH